MSTVRVQDVRLSRGGRVVLDGINLEVNQGEVVAVMGASGSGKTTLLRAIAGLDAFEHGSIDVDGVKVVSGAPSQAVIRHLRRKVGMVFQFHCLFEHLPVIKNVWLGPVHVQAMPRVAAERAALDLLRTLGVDHRANAWPRELSGGEAQRVAIARALAMDPQVLLMDEPTASLDSARRVELANVVRQLVGRNRTLLIATHDEEFANLTATRVVTVSGGCMV
jgi:ABC-type polar amino acid transport system ATPase subunit